jgi:hypothetical protein
MNNTETFRCYYDDGTIITDSFCPETNSNGSPLVTSELTIIENVEETIGFPWLLLVLGMILLTSDER